MFYFSTYLKQMGITPLLATNSSQIRKEVIRTVFHMYAMLFQKIYLYSQYHVKLSQKLKSGQFK